MFKVRLNRGRSRKNGFIGITREVVLILPEYAADLLESSDHCVLSVRDADYFAERIDSRKKVLDDAVADQTNRAPNGRLRNP